VRSTGGLLQQLGAICCNHQPAWVPPSSPGVAWGCDLSYDYVKINGEVGGGRIRAMRGCPSGRMGAAGFGVCFGSRLGHTCGHDQQRRVGTHHTMCDPSTSQAECQYHVCHPYLVPCAVHHLKRCWFIAACWRWASCGSRHHSDILCDRGGAREKSALEPELQ
jgi:hypothetical protein